MTSRTISLGLQPIGLLVGGALIDLTSGSATIAVIGIAVAAVSLVFAPLAVPPPGVAHAAMRARVRLRGRSARTWTADELDADGAVRALERVARRHRSSPARRTMDTRH